MNIRPVAQPNTKPALPFPFNLRVLMFGWKALFLSSAPLPVGSQGQSPAWLRGQYLGNVMGHCAECHTPRGMFGQMQKDGSEEHTSELQSPCNLVCRLLLEKKKKISDCSRHTSATRTATC